LWCALFSNFGLWAAVQNSIFKLFLFSLLDHYQTSCTGIFEVKWWESSSNHYFQLESDFLFCCTLYLSIRHCLHIVLSKSGLWEPVIQLSDHASSVSSYDQLCGLLSRSQNILIASSW
jgi:hypothetical protein